MHVEVGHFRSQPAERPEGDLTETLGLTVRGYDDEIILAVVIDPHDDSYLIQIDRFEDGSFGAVDASTDRVMIRVPRGSAVDADSPLPDNVRPLPARPQDAPTENA